MDEYFNIRDNYGNYLFFYLKGFGKTRLDKHFVDLKHEAKSEGQDMKFTKLWMAIPCFLDTCGSTMYLISLFLMPASL